MHVEVIPVRQFKLLAVSMDDRKWFSMALFPMASPNAVSSTDIQAYTLKSPLI